MNLIREWNNMQEIIKRYPTYKNSTIYNSIKHKKSGYGYFWQYKNKTKNNKIELHKDEVFKNLGKVDNKDFSNYEISNYGNVKNISRNCYLKITKDLGGYPIITLNDKITHKAVTKKIHYLVAIKFIGKKIKAKPSVNHIDKNKTNNYYKNLEWTTSQKNSEHSRAKKVNQIDPKTNKIINTFISIRSAMCALNTNRSAGISNCCNGKAKTAHGYKWEFVKAAT